MGDYIDFRNNIGFLSYMPSELLVLKQLFMMYGQILKLNDTTFTASKRNLLKS
jgi:hypothetical protein